MGSGGEDQSSSISNGLLPAALALGVATTTATTTPRWRTRTGRCTCPQRTSPRSRRESTTPGTSTVRDSTWAAKSRTTALYLFAATPLGQERDSDGFLAQFTYKFGDTKLGVNYGESNLDPAPGEAPSSLVMTNKKYTVGIYHSLTESLTLLGEFTDTKAESHDGLENDSSNFNIGAYLSF
jgi:hypothetical protein